MRSLRQRARKHIAQLFPATTKAMMADRNPAAANLGRM